MAGIAALALAIVSSAIVSSVIVTAGIPIITNAVTDSPSPPPPSPPPPPPPPSPPVLGDCVPFYVNETTHAGFIDGTDLCCTDNAEDMDGVCQSEMIATTGSVGSCGNVDLPVTPAGGWVMVGSCDTSAPACTAPDPIYNVLAESCPSHLRFVPYS